jgi:hypothetical protein
MKRKYEDLPSYLRARKLELLKQQIKRLHAYERREDAHFRSWLKSECFQDDFVETPTRVLLPNYFSWCAKTRQRQRSSTAWGRWMGAHYLKRDRVSVRKVYVGIGLKPVAGIN